MHLIYLHMYGGNPSSGVNKKIIAQANNLHDTGIDFKLVLISGINNNYPNFDFIDFQEINHTTLCKSKLMKSVIRQLHARKYIKNIVKYSTNNTILYLRYPLPLFLTPFDIPKKKNCKVVLECNSIEIEEQKKQKIPFKYLLEILFGKSYRKNVDAIIGVTDEITHYQITRSGQLNKPSLTIGNGFAVESVPVRQIPHYTDKEFHILCVANVSHWHGLDRLLQGLAIYSETPNVVLHIAGGGAELPTLQKMVNELGIANQVVFHGFLTGNALNTLFDQCHIAVGSLGIHRKGLTQTSELKAREYCARGSPYVIAVSDPDFPEDFPYILHLPADESPIDIERVVTFAKDVCADPEHPQKMRLYAKEHLDWSVKMKRLKGFLETLL